MPLRKNSKKLHPLRRLRAKAKLSETALAEKAGLDRLTISYIENGKRTPRPETLGKLAEALGVEYEQLQNAIDEFEAMEGAEAGKV